MKVGIIFGTRPEIIKMARIMQLAKAHPEIDAHIIHTGQHYSYNMSTQFMEELGLPKIATNLEVGSGTHNYQLGSMLLKLETMLKKRGVQAILVQGDTNSVLAGALCANRCNIKVGHVEAGLRSFDREMPEELNRILTDAISDHCYAPTDIAVKNLKKENVNDERIFLTGNTIVDTINFFLPRAKEREKTINHEEYGVVTLHRPKNVDNPKKLAELIKALNHVQDQYGLPLVFPTHPRTKNNLIKHGILNKVRIELIEPLGYFDFLKAMSESKIVITDSGGLQEEACVLGVPCVTVRNSTERPETVRIGSNHLAGTTYQGVVKGVEKMLGAKGAWQHPYGDGASSEKILNLLLSS